MCIRDSFRSIHILKPFLEPIQRFLLGLLLPLRALAALANGRADPVATATLAAACLAIGLGTMFYAHFIHSYVMWALGWFFTILLYIIGVALFGPVWKSTSELGYTSRRWRGAPEI